MNAPSKPQKVPIYEPDALEVDGQLISHNVWVSGHRTSVRLEAVMWKSLHEIAEIEGTTIHQLITMIAARRHETSTLTATIRAFLVAYFRALHVSGKKGPLLSQVLGDASA
ncbi:ribbon-helix-helix domain-containing protein [Rhodocista pekingensis]|uniref:Ribbon-helix-helix domain-containing protein n=1 Tax=Rhodocista pekingensis TaxID=201185 RepID=A0ABW2L141_9PROT